jgi:hypothetical protein
MTKCLPIVRSLVLVGMSVLISACSSISSQATKAAEQAAWQQYQQQVSWIKSGDSNANFTTLREAFSRTARYAPYSVRPVEAAIAEYEQQQFAQCVTAAEQTLARQFGHIQAHFLAMICQRELGNLAAAEFHDSVVRGLLTSIDQSGDGQSIATAITTYDMQELHTYIELMGLTMVRQSLVTENDRWYDVITVTYEDEEREFDLYFDITQQFQRGFL